jgi:hypothetical protein
VCGWRCSMSFSLNLGFPPSSSAAAEIFTYVADCRQVYFAFCLRDTTANFFSTPSPPARLLPFPSGELNVLDDSV